MFLGCQSTFYSTLFTQLGIAIASDVAHHLTKKNATRSWRLAKTKTTEHKCKRKVDECEHLKLETEGARKDRSKHEQKGSVRQSGTVMSGRHSEADTATAPAKKLRAAKLKPNKKGELPRCCACKELGHWQPSNKLCSLCVPRGGKKMGDSKANDQLAAPVPTVEDEMQQMANEMDDLDVMPFENRDDTVESEAFCSAASEFESEEWHGS